MEYKYRVHTLKFIISSIFFIFLMVIGISLLTINRYGSALIFLLLALIFSAVALMSGSTIHISSSGIRQTYFGITVRSLKWDEIAEIGVIGTKVFNKKHPERTGTLYFYFSKVTMTNEERFNMALKWPPFTKIYLLYTDSRLNNIQSFWSSHIVTFNTGDLPL